MSFLKYLCQLTYAVELHKMMEIMKYGNLLLSSCHLLIVKMEKVQQCSFVLFF